MTRLSRIAHRHTALIVAVLVALVLAQSLGLLHRLAHGARGGEPVAAEAVVAAQQPAGTWLKTLFGGHDQDAGACDLYDQLTHADALASMPALMLPAVQPLPPAERHRAWHLAAQSAGFLARGPPSLS